MVRGWKIIDRKGVKKFELKWKSSDLYLLMDDNGGVFRFTRVKEEAIWGGVEYLIENAEKTKVEISRNGKLLWVVTKGDGNINIEQPDKSIIPKDLP